jgi:hypothetical protein
VSPLSARTNVMVGLCAAALICCASIAGAKDFEVAPGVAPVEELEILDPQVDPEGKPRMQAIVGADGYQRLTIPPTVIVHKHYYTGDRDFQGPMLQGGPTLLSVAHPVTGERINVEVQLPPGAPRIYYRSDLIVYVFRDVRVVVDFGKPCLIKTDCCKPTITMIQRTAHDRHWERCLESKHDCERDWLQRTGVADVMHHTHQHCKQTANAAAGYVKQAGQFVITRFDAAKAATPIGGLMQPAP